MIEFYRKNDPLPSKTLDGEKIKKYFSQIKKKKSPNMRSFLLLFVFFIPLYAATQSLEVKKWIPNINASGGVTVDKEGFIYVSDFGAEFSPQDSTSVYKVDPETGEVSVFATGFKGASGACFDSKGNFYQSNPHGNQVSKVSPDGEIIYDFATEGLKTPVGLVANSKDELFVCNCAEQNIMQIADDGSTSVFAESEHFACPNGLTLIENDTMVAVNFSNGKIVKISPAGEVSVLAELPTLQGGPNPVGNGHLTYAHGFLFVTSIGKGTVHKISLDGQAEHIAGKGGFVNTEGPAMDASFSKPNGIAISPDGNTLYINVSDPSWVSNPKGLHPAHLMTITNICSLPDVECKK